MYLDDSVAGWLASPDAQWLTPVLACAIAVVIALIAHRLLFGLAQRLSSRSAGLLDDIVVSRGAAPMRWIFVTVGLAAVHRSFSANERIETLWLQAAGIVLPGLCGWFAIAAIRAVRDIVEVRADVSLADNLRARRNRTRARLLARLAMAIILFLTLGTMLLSIPGVRTLGITLMASAGIAGIVVGSAAQPALKNLIAGVQMAFTEPIRLDDVVISQGEWGKVEEIGLTYVVLKLWDERRLIVPISKFLEEPFQNWTRSTSQLLGTVMIYVDATADIARLRVQAAIIVDRSALWDRRFTNLQVTELRPDCIELRILATASDAARAFDLRCEIREGLMMFLRDVMPEALPRHRIAGLQDRG